MPHVCRNSLLRRGYGPQNWPNRSPRTHHIAGPHLRWSRSANSEAQIRRASSSMEVCGLHRPTSIGCSQSGTSVATSVLLGRRSACTLITGSASVPVHGCGLRVSATIRHCSPGMFVRDWDRDPLASCPGEIQALYGELLDRKLSGRMICYTHSVLFSALRQAVRWKLLLENPAQDVHLPRQARRHLIVLDVEQSRQLGNGAARATKKESQLG